jgi:hypothetical protein
VDFDDIKPILDNVKTEPPDAGHQVTIFWDSISDNFFN